MYQEENGSELATLLQISCHNWEYCHCRVLERTKVTALARKIERLFPWLKQLPPRLTLLKWLELVPKSNAFHLQQERAHVCQFLQTKQASTLAGWSFGIWSFQLSSLPPIVQKYAHHPPMLPVHQITLTNVEKMGILGKRKTFRLSSETPYFSTFKSLPPRTIFLLPSWMIWDMETQLPHGNHSDAQRLYPVDSRSLQQQRHPMIAEWIKASQVHIQWRHDQGYKAFPESTYTYRTVSENLYEIFRGFHCLHTKSKPNLAPISIILK